VTGKANLHEFAYGVTSQNPHYGTVPNPLASDRLAGGSSGGSAAALAAGDTELALGTDSGGSVRIPAACCGVVGFKPTYGLVSAEGCFPLAPSFDHVGPLARSVAGCAAAMDVLAPHVERRALESLDELTVGVAWLDLCDAGVRERVARAAASFPHRADLELALPEGSASVFMREAAAVHRDLFAAHAEAYGEDVRTKLERCLAVTDDEYAEGLRARQAYRETLDRTAAPFDLLVTPTLAFVAPHRDTRELEVRDAMVRLTYPFNLTGWPALALPCGRAEHGLPASVQLVGRPGDDGLVLAAGALLERALAR
jgi:aspartyl-tRNA(Asn)/glutamyl-tRNA(Gln) amidotransferase subunit A